ncbi:Crp/Fnr family transcriptional regulator [Dyadobacter tibetensis]|uniref:Crp/Fnr family transcriptional regulator n=1 Tax=Dyadobacter tibetensis TaxID=1211851 RepID=UPI0004714F65|nr:Crp/Fnr family transcriptional regulator [Dyadobacter tibetensis]
MNEKLLGNISKYISLSLEEINLLEAFWSERTLDKGDYLLRNGSICRTDNYIVSGALKAFYINSDNGKEEILYFSIDDWWATDLHSFQKQTPSIYNIQALEETHLLQISRSDFEVMLAQIPKLERYFRLILEGYLGTLQRRIIQHQVFNAEQRYSDFIEKYPEISDKVPQYLIASYLGISPEFLSRIRKKQKNH